MVSKGGAEPATRVFRFGNDRLRLGADGRGLRSVLLGQATLSHKRTSCSRVLEFIDPVIFKHVADKQPSV